MGVGSGPTRGTQQRQSLPWWRGMLGPWVVARCCAMVGTYVLEVPEAFINCPEGPRLEYIGYMQAIFTKLGGT